MIDTPGDPSKGTLDSEVAENDVYLIKAITKGNKDAFKIIFERYYNPLIRFAFRYVQCQSIAEGLVQDIFVWIWENRRSWTVDRNLKTYLFRAVKNRAIDYWRKESTYDKYVEDYSAYLSTFITESDTINEPEESDFVRAARIAIEELPNKPRMIYKLNRLEGLTYREIAEVLEISPKTVESNMSRALNSLRQKLSSYMPVLLMISFVSNILIKS